MSAHFDEEARVFYPPKIQGDFHSLEAAKAASDAYVSLEGDFGGDVYVISSVSKVDCNESTLAQLLNDIDLIEWPRGEWPPVDLSNDEGNKSWELWYLRYLPEERYWESRYPDGIIEGIWYSKEMIQKGFVPHIRAVLEGKQDRMLPLETLKEYAARSRENYLSTYEHGIESFDTQDPSVIRKRLGLP